MHICLLIIPVLGYVGQIFSNNNGSQALTVLGCLAFARGPALPSSGLSAPPGDGPALTGPDPAPVTPAAAAVALRRRGGRRRGRPTLIGRLPLFESHRPTDCIWGAAEALGLARAAFEPANHNAQKGLRKLQGGGGGGRGRAVRAEQDGGGRQQQRLPAGQCGGAGGSSGRWGCREPPSVGGRGGVGGLWVPEVRGAGPARCRAASALWGAGDRLRARPFAASGRPGAAGPLCAVGRGGRPRWAPPLIGRSSSPCLFYAGLTLNVHVCVWQHLSAALSGAWERGRSRVTQSGAGRPIRGWEEVEEGKRCGVVDHPGGGERNAQSWKKRLRSAVEALGTAFPQHMQCSGGMDAVLRAVAFMGSSVCSEGEEKQETPQRRWAESGEREGWVLAKAAP